MSFEIRSAIASFPVLMQMTSDHDLLVLTPAESPHWLVPRAIQAGERVFLDYTEPKIRHKYTFIDMIIMKSELKLAHPTGTMLRAAQARFDKFTNH
jgi:hypothetical protein